MDGVVKFLEDLQLDPSSRTVLIIAWKFKVATYIYAGANDPCKLFFPAVRISVRPLYQ